MRTTFQFNSILIVDDDEISSFVSTTVLQKAKIAPQLQTVSNGRQALEFLKNACGDNHENSFCPILLFLDLDMPVMNGFEFLEAFTSDDRFRQINICIVVLTSSVHWQDQQRAIRYPIVGFMSKPVTVEKLQALFTGSLSQPI